MSVIKEVPVFLSKSCMENLLLFEFPSRPKQQPIKDSSVLDCRYKPKFQHAELSLSLDTSSANYDRHRGQDLGRLAPDQFQRSGGLFDRHLLRSLPCPPAGRRQRCAGARFHGDGDGGSRLVICPMPAGGRLVLQPAMDHLDAKPADVAAADAAAAAAAAAAPPEAKAVTLRFARQETPEARQRREQSHRASQRLLAQEPWLRCRWLGRADDDDDSPDPLLAAADAAAETADSGKRGGGGGGPGDYLARLCPLLPAASPDAGDAAAASTVSGVGGGGGGGSFDRSPSVSLARLRAMPCDERLRALLRSACVLRWGQLVDLLKQCGMTHAQLTESLAQIHSHLSDLACLVHGLWVVKSEVLYPAGTLSMHSGVPAEAMCRGRDYILCRFVQGRTVTRKEVASLVKMPSEEISQILGRISRVVSHSGGGGGDPGSQRAPKMRLAFVAEEDTEYIRRNADVVNKAQYYWEAKWKLLSEQLKLDKASRAFRTVSLSMSTGGGGGRRRSRTRSARWSTSSSSDSSSTRVASGGGPSGARKRRVGSQPRVSVSGGGGGGGGGSGRRHCVSMSDGGADPESRSPSPLPPAAAPPPHPPPPSAPAELQQRLRRFLLAKLQDRMVAGCDELLRLFRAEADLVAGGGAADAALQLPASEEACRRLFDATAESLGVTVLSAGAGGGSGGSGGSIYALALDSQPHPRHRQELLAALLAGGSQVTLAQLRSRCELAGLDALSEAALKALVKDYCAFRGKAYYVKGFQHGS